MLPTGIPKTAVSRETSERLNCYVDLLLKWGRSISLVSRGELSAAALNRHVEISLTLAAWMPAGSAFLDLGSGNGFPAIPLAIMSGCPAELIEADRRKASFLQTVAATLELPVRVTAARIEATAPRAARCITARALAPLPSLLPLIARHLHPDGVALLLKGLSIQQELECLEGWDLTADQPGGGEVLRITRLVRRGPPS